MDPNNSYAILGRMAGDGVLVAAERRAIEEDEGLSAEDFAEMEADVRANPDRYPVLHKLLTDPGPACTETPKCKGYVGMCSHGGW